MADIFGAEKNAHSAEEIVMSSGVLVSIGGPVHLAQQVNLQYQRQIQPIYELGSEDIWVSITPASGTCTINRAVGQDDPYEFVKGDECKGYDIALGEGKGKCTKKCPTITATGCYTTSCGLQAQAGQGFLTEDMNIFVSCVNK